MIRHTLAAGAFLLFVFALVGLLNACGPTMNPNDAHRIEMAQCQKAGDAEAVWRCEQMVSKKYGRYFGEGNYP